jgi:hypothetical protein
LLCQRFLLGEPPRLRSERRSSRPEMAPTQVTCRQPQPTIVGSLIKMGNGGTGRRATTGCSTTNRLVNGHPTPVLKHKTRFPPDDDWKPSHAFTVDDPLQALGSRCPVSCDACARRKARTERRRYWYMRSRTVDAEVEKAMRAAERLQKSLNAADAAPVRERRCRGNGSLVHPRARQGADQIDFQPGNSEELCRPGQS